MHFSVISLLPNFVTTLTQYGVVGRAFDKNIVGLDCINPRDFTDNKYQTVDDRPYGGGPGMVMMAEPLHQAIQSAKNQHSDAPVIYLSPKGEPLCQKILSELSEQPSLILLSGRYEGIDQRIIDETVDREISIGDYVLSGGELPAMVLMDGITRLLPEVLGHKDSAVQDSFVEEGLLDCPHYTRPEEWHGKKVPDILLSGNHAKIEQWRCEQAKKLTRQKRPDLSSRKV